MSEVRRFDKGKKGMVENSTGRYVLYEDFAEIVSGYVSAISTINALSLNLICKSNDTAIKNSPALNPKG